MKKNLFLMFTALLICGLSFTVLTSCSSSDDNDPTSNIYVYGFDSMNTSDLSEMATIENAFKTAIGVSESPFTYTQGESKLKSDCEKAGNALNNQVFTGKYVFVVNKATGGNVYTWKN